MKITKIEAYMAICDHCGESASGINDYTVFINKEDAAEAAMESSWVEYKGNLYCGDCAKVDDDDKVILTIEGRKNINK